MIAWLLRCFAFIDAYFQFSMLTLMLALLAATRRQAIRRPRHQRNGTAKAPCRTRSLLLALAAAEFCRYYFRYYYFCRDAFAAMLPSCQRAIARYY